MATGDGKAQDTHEGGLLAVVDPSTEDGRAFLQDRISLLGRWFFAVAAAFYLLQNFPLDVLLSDKKLDWIEEWFGFKERLQLGVVAIAAAIWLLPRKRVFSPARLQALEAGGVILASTLIALMLFDDTFIEGRVFQVFVLVLAVTNLLTVRAILIPSTMRRTLAICAGAFTPANLIVAYIIMDSAAFGTVKSAHIIIATLMWSAIATTSAVVASGILFLLRRRVSKASKLGRYQLEEKIGQGGMGVVYRASHATLRRPTAIKLLSPERNTEGDLRRFEREVRWTAKLSHPNTVAIYDYGRTPSGVFYCAMELIDGLTLEELVTAHGPQEPSRVIHILRQACGALQEAHEAGIIHRDIKPANIMVSRLGGAHDVVKVLDFGLVKLLTRDEQEPDLSATDAVIGTPAYLSPEAIDDPKSVDLRSDLYSLAAVGYYLLTGTRMYDGQSVMSICMKHLVSSPEPPSERLGRSVPDDLEEILLTCLSKAPDERPASARELSRGLSSCDAAGKWNDNDALSWWSEHRPSPQRSSAPEQDSVER